MRRIILAERWQRYRRTGDSRAREDLILAYSPIVKVVAGRVAGRLPAHVTAADLMSDGFRGLTEAVERFDPTRGASFEPYARTRVQGAIFDGLRSLDWVPREVRAQAREIERATGELAMRLRRTPTDDELAGELGMSRAQLDEVLLSVAESHVVALDEPWGLAGIDGPHATRLDTLPDPSAPDPAVRIDEDDQRERIGAALRQLPDREQVILGLHYHQELTFTQIGEVIGVSGSRVSQLHTRAAIQLRTLMAPVA